MNAPFAVSTTSRYDRLAKALQRRRPEFAGHQRSALEILSADPHNRSRRHNIKKLEGVAPGDGQYPDMRLHCGIQLGWQLERSLRAGRPAGRRAEGGVWPERTTSILQARPFPMPAEA